MIQDVKTDIYGNPLAFRRDPHMRNAETKIGLSKEHIQEILKCKADPVYFMEHYCYINDPNKGRALIKLYDWQKRLVRHLQENRFSILMLPRQSGKCVYFFIKIRVRNKKTNKIRTISIGRFYLEQKIKKILHKLLTFCT